MKKDPKTKWLIRDIVKIDRGIQKQLLAATPNWSDCIDFMRYAAERSYKGRAKPGQYIAIILFVDGVFVGWAMCDVLLSRQSPLFRTYVYVKTQHRRNGYGTLLIRKARQVAKRRGKGIRVCPHNGPSRQFFQSAKVTETEVAPGYYLK